MGNLIKSFTNGQWTMDETLEKTSPLASARPITPKKKFRINQLKTTGKGGFGTDPNSADTHKKMLDSGHKVENHFEHAEGTVHMYQHPEHGYTIMSHSREGTPGGTLKTKNKDKANDHFNREVDHYKKFD
jgi:hypothetical protein